MKRFSPSSTETFLTCPLKWSIRRRGWEPRRLNKGGLARILGTGFATGVSAWNITRSIPGTRTSPDVCAEAGVTTVKRMLQEADDLGLVTSDFDIPLRASLESRLVKSIHGYVNADPVPSTWRVRDVETTLPEWGNCRIDVAFDTPAGVVVMDYKTTLSLYRRAGETEAIALSKKAADYGMSEQRFHYTEAYGDYTGEPVTAFYICLVVMEPFRTHLFPFTTNRELQQAWQLSREGWGPVYGTWDLMDMQERGQLMPQMAATHESRYGPCEYRQMNSCAGLRLDDHQYMEQDFAKKESK